MVQQDRLQLSAQVWVDSAWVDRLARGALQEESGPWEEGVQTIRDVRGELLAGWYDDWVLVQRERFRQLRVHLLEEASARLLRRGRFGAALDLALEVVEAEPLRESGHCAVISVHLAEGNYGEALRQFRVFQRLVGEELGVGPSPRLQALLRPPPLVPEARRTSAPGAVGLTRR